MNLAEKGIHASRGPIHHIGAVRVQRALEAEVAILHFSRFTGRGLTSKTVGPIVSGIGRASGGAISKMRIGLRVPVILMDEGIESGGHLPEVAVGRIPSRPRRTRSTDLRGIKRILMNKGRPRSRNPELAIRAIVPRPRCAKSTDRWSRPSLCPLSIDQEPREQHNKNDLH